MSNELKTLNALFAEWKEEWGDNWPKRALDEVMDEYLLFLMIEGEAEPVDADLYHWLIKMITAGVAATGDDGHGAAALTPGPLNDALRAKGHDSTNKVAGAVLGRSTGLS